METASFDDASLVKLVENNPGQGTLEEYQYFPDVIRAKAPCRILTPKTLPITKNIVGPKPFLFGPQKPRPECYPFSD